MEKHKHQRLATTFMNQNQTIVALVPARGGSKRVPNKNIRMLNEMPLIAHTINSAKESNIYTDIIVSTDYEEIASVAREYGACVPFLRPSEYAGDLSPDIEWVLHALELLKADGKEYDAFSILRPTSPFRTAGTIRKAWKVFLEADGVDSLRAVEKCKQHPAKMWRVRDNRMTPVLPGKNGDTPWHSCQYQSLPEIYAQNASLEIAWTRLPLEAKSIAGSVVAPFFTEAYEGFDINTEEDWSLAEKLMEEGKVTL